MPEDTTELIHANIENHELRLPHGGGEDAECRSMVAALEARISELEAEAHRHAETDEERFEEVEEV